LFTAPKLVNSYRTYDNAFAYSDKPFFGGADLTYITNFEEEKLDLFFLLGLLNSDLIYVWFYFRGKRKGEMLELKQVPVSEVPIARDFYFEEVIAKEAKAIYKTLTTDRESPISKQMDSINNLVYELYNLSLSEIEVIKEFVAMKSELRKSRNLDDVVEES
jgi:adenine-specific DNA-methyltransferase